ncbi:MAG TPA: hypothetical protein VMP01_06230 [Pirellulaceae bacterium]|nr:hypothetical protein [Pirellulaceae bacterium]
MFDVDALVTNNPRYWLAHYEIAPGDPAVIVLHAGLLLAGCEPTRGAYVLLIGGQRPGIPQPIRDAMDQLRYAAIRALEPSNQAIQAGIKLHDQGQHDLALQKYEEALALCPQSGFAHFEWGLTFREKQWAAAGVAPPPPDKISVNDDRPTPAESIAMVLICASKSPRRGAGTSGACRGANPDSEGQGKGPPGEKQLFPLG